MKRILKFNESILPHEITDYFLHFTEVERLFLYFEFRGAYGCHKTATLGSDGDSILKIDSKNIQKILDAIKSNSVKNCNLEAFMPYLEELNPTDMSK